MDCKVIRGFDLLLLKRFTVCCFSFVEESDKFNGNLLWFGTSPRGALVKTTTYTQ